MSSSPVKKKKKTATEKSLLKSSPVELTTPNPSLPDDLLLSCFARASTLYYPTFSLVSKSFSSLLTSPEIYQTRSLLGRTESCLYVCLKFKPYSNPRWFTLCLKPNQTLTNNTKKKSSGYALAPIAIPQSPQAYSDRATTVFGSDIYFIGGPINESPSSSVSILDCKSNTWREGPCMLLKRSFPITTVFEEKIYVAGGRIDFKPGTIFMEVFDPKTQTWEACVDPSSISIKVKVSFQRSVVIKEKIYMLGPFESESRYCDRKRAAYNVKKNSWEKSGFHHPELESAGRSSCMIDNVLYTYYELTKIKWYYSNLGYWKTVKGLQSLRRTGGASVRLVDYGGKMVVLWDKSLHSSGYKEKAIWCAVIALERRNNNHEIWGSVEWFGNVRTVPESCGLICALTATV